jgi:tRNA modification GTPase
MFNPDSETIVALSTPPGIGAIGVIRISGEKAIAIANEIFRGKNLTEQQTHTLHFGNIYDKEKLIDEVVMGLFRKPNSYTKEDVVEISCHGSPFILNTILNLILKKGARLAKPGEFTMRSFLNGRMDLAQAEAVADLIASESESAHQSAMNQMRGGFSAEIKRLRRELIQFASLLELELDFGEEDVEFADRKQLVSLIEKINIFIKKLIDSFQLGNVIRNGVNTVIAGRPNAGKSTLLNALLNEERAIVSEIAGTTRDTIEEILNIDGILFRLIDTAGLRDAESLIEKIGVEKTMEKIRQSAIVIYLFDVNEMNEDEVIKDVQKLNLKDIPFLIAGNKIDQVNKSLKSFSNLSNSIFVSAKQKQHLQELKDRLLKMIFEKNTSENTIVTNARHLSALQKTYDVLDNARKGLIEEFSQELIAIEIRSALDYLGMITGEITNDDLLENIFRNFCIGK